MGMRQVYVDQSEWVKLDSIKKKSGYKTLAEVVAFLVEREEPVLIGELKEAKRNRKK